MGGCLVCICVPGVIFFRGVVRKNFVTGHPYIWGVKNELLLLSADVMILLLNQAANALPDAEFASLGVEIGDAIYCVFFDNAPPHVAMKRMSGCEISLAWAVGMCYIFSAR